VAAVEYFLKLTGIKGGSNDAKHKDEIDVDSFAWGAAMLDSGALGAGAGAGKAQVQDLSITARASVASPLLFQACVSGQHLKDAVFSVRQAGGSEFLRILMTDVVVSSYQIGGHEVEQPLDQVTLGFGKVTIEYRPMKPDGSAGPAVTATWDRRSGKSA
jgi:type VI secretion system secreted protein Hcp